MNTQKQKTIIGFRKAQSLLGKIVEMVSDDRYCIDIIQQNLAVIGLLKSANQQLLDGHLSSCFTSAMETNSPAKKQKMVAEILSVSRLANK